MARRLKNNLSKRRTRKNTLKRKGRKKYTRGGVGFAGLMRTRPYEDAMREINALKLQIQTLEEKAEEDKYAQEIEMQTLKANCLNGDQVARLKERFNELKATHELQKRQSEALVKRNQQLEATVELHEQSRRKGIRSF